MTDKVKSILDSYCYTTPPANRVFHADVPTHVYNNWTKNTRKKKHENYGTYRASAKYEGKRNINKKKTYR